MINSIAFVPDGNRRFADQNNLSLKEAYTLGVKKAWQTMHWLEKYPSIKTGSFYALSLKNMKRHKHELNILFKIFEEEFKKAVDSDYLKSTGTKIKFIGRTDLLGKKTQSCIERIESITADFNSRLINIALGYDGKQEIVDAAITLAKEFKQGNADLDKINEKNFSQYLYNDFPAPDLIVRTSGEQRLSGFLTFQSAYSELYFSKKHWPEFTQYDLKNAINDFNSRKRRFGA